VSTKPFAPSSPDETHEAPFPRLHDDAGQLRPRKIERDGRTAVEPNASLGDQPARFARRDAEDLGEDCREMQRVALGERVFGNVLRRAPLANDACEVVLRCAR
jgi:hypothetical protein